MGTLINYCPVAFFQNIENYGDNYEVIENINNSRNISKINYDSLLENDSDLIG